MNTKERAKCITNIIQDIDSEVELNGELNWNHLKMIVRTNGIYDQKWDISESIEMERYVHDYVVVLHRNKGVPLYGNCWELLAARKSADSGAYGVD